MMLDFLIFWSSVWSGIWCTGTVQISQEMSKIIGLQSKHNSGGNFQPFCIYWISNVWWKAWSGPWSIHAGVNCNNNQLLFALSLDRFLSLECKLCQQFYWAPRIIVHWLHCAYSIILVSYESLHCAHSIIHNIYGSLYCAHSIILVYESLHCAHSIILVYDSFHCAHSIILVYDSLHCAHNTILICASLYCAHSIILYMIHCTMHIIFLY